MRCHIYDIHEKEYGRDHFVEGSPAIVANMDNTNTYESVASQHSFSNHTGNMIVQSGVGYESTQSDRAALRTFFNDYGCRPDGFMHNVAATAQSGGDFRGLYSSSQFVCQPTGHFSNVVPPTLVNTYNDRDLSYQTYNPQYRSGLQTSPCVPFSTPRQLRQWGEDRQQSHGAPARTESDAAIQRKRDSQWVKCFTRNRNNPTNVPQKRKKLKSDLKPVLYRVAQLVTQLDTFCNTLRTNINDCDVWTDSYTEALNLKKELEDKFAVIDCVHFDAWKRKLHRNAERRTRKKQQDAEKRRQERISEKEAVIDAWRLRQIRSVEEKKKVTPVKKQNLAIYLYIHTHAFVYVCTVAEPQLLHFRNGS